MFGHAKCFCGSRVKASMIKKKKKIKEHCITQSFGDWMCIRKIGMTTEMQNKKVRSKKKNNSDC